MAREKTSSAKNEFALLLYQAVDKLNELRQLVAILQTADDLELQSQIQELHALIVQQSGEIRAIHEGRNNRLIFLTTCHYMGLELMSTPFAENCQRILHREAFTTLTKKLETNGSEGEVRLTEPMLFGLLAVYFWACFKGDNQNVGPEERLSQIPAITGELLRRGLRKASQMAGQRKTIRQFFKMGRDLINEVADICQLETVTYKQQSLAHLDYLLETGQTLEPCSSWLMFIFNTGNKKLSGKCPVMLKILSVDRQQIAFKKPQKRQRFDQNQSP